MKKTIVCMLLMAVCQYAAADEDRQWIAGWRQLSPMNTVRAGAAVVKVGRRIYMLGGVDGIRYLDSGEYTEIGADGSLSPWRMTTPLQEARGFFSAVAKAGYIYAVGGANGRYGKHLLNTIERAKILADGSLGPWQTVDQSLVYPRRCVKLALVGGHIYALGGFGGTLLDSVESASIQDDGSLGSWRLETRKMTMPRYVNTVKRAGDVLYVIGGHRETEGVGLAAVEYARLDGRQRLTAWRSTQALQQGRFGLAAAAQGQWLYALGGLDGAIYVDRIEKSHINADGTLSKWHDTTPLPSARANFSTVVHEGRLYILGGTNRDGYYNSVATAVFNTDGDIGFYGTAQQARLVQQQHKAQAVAAQLPNTGTVVDIIQTRAYSYLKVNGEGGNRWLAAPRGDYGISDRIEYSRGLTMTGFYSRTLQRRFDEILFVERVRKKSKE